MSFFGFFGSPPPPRPNRSFSYKRPTESSTSFRPASLSPLVDAILRQDIKGVKITAPRSDVNLKDAEGWAPIHLAVYTLNPDILSILIENGADVNATTKTGITPLHLVVTNGDPPRDNCTKDRVIIAQLLLDNGADIYAKTIKRPHSFKKDMIIPSVSIMESIEALKSDPSLASDCRALIDFMEDYYTTKSGFHPSTLMNAKVKTNGGRRTHKRRKTKKTKKTKKTNRRR